MQRGGLNNLGEPEHVPSMPSPARGGLHAQAAPAGISADQAARQHQSGQVLTEEQQRQERQRQIARILAQPEVHAQPETKIETATPRAISLQASQTLSPLEELAKAAGSAKSLPTQGSQFELLVAQFHEQNKNIINSSRGQGLGGSSILSAGAAAGQSGGVQDILMLGKRNFEQIQGATCDLAQQTKLDLASPVLGSRIGLEAAHVDAIQALHLLQGAQALSTKQVLAPPTRVAHTQLQLQNLNEAEATAVEALLTVDKEAALADTDMSQTKANFLGRNGNQISGVLRPFSVNTSDGHAPMVPLKAADELPCPHTLMHQMGMRERREAAGGAHLGSIQSAPGSYSTASSLASLSQSVSSLVSNPEHGLLGLSRGAAVLDPGLLSSLKDAAVRSVASSRPISGVDPYSPLSAELDHYNHSADDLSADAETLASITSIASKTSVSSTGSRQRDSHSPRPSARQSKNRRQKVSADAHESCKNKNCHFCEHAPKRTAFFACLSPSCDQTFCENCCARHLGKPTNFQKQADADACDWRCPLCTRDCCCVQPVCNRKHLHCKRYRRKLKNWRALTAASGSLVGAAASGGFVSGSLGFTGPSMSVGTGTPPGLANDAVLRQGFPGI